MSRSKAPEDLTVDELRQLLVEKRRKTRQEHLERFRRTGRVVSLASDLETPSLQAPAHRHSPKNRRRSRRRRGGSAAGAFSTGRWC